MISYVTSCYRPLISYVTSCYRPFAHRSAGPVVDMAQTLVTTVMNGTAASGGFCAGGSCPAMIANFLTMFSRVGAWLANRNWAEDASPPPAPSPNPPPRPLSPSPTPPRSLGVCPNAAGENCCTVYNDYTLSWDDRSWCVNNCCLDACAPGYCTKPQYSSTTGNYEPPQPRDSSFACNPDRTRNSHYNQLCGASCPDVAWSEGMVSVCNVPPPAQPPSPPITPPSPPITPTCSATDPSTGGTIQCCGTGVTTSDNAACDTACCTGTCAECATFSTDAKCQSGGSCYSNCNPQSLMYNTNYGSWSNRCVDHLGYPAPSPSPHLPPPSPSYPTWGYDPSNVYTGDNGDNGGPMYIFENNVMTAAVIESIFGSWPHCLCYYFTPESSGDIFPLVRRKAVQAEACNSANAGSTCSGFNSEADALNTIAEILELGFRASKLCGSSHCREFFNTIFTTADTLINTNVATTPSTSTGATCTAATVRTCGTAPCFPWVSDSGSSAPAECSGCYLPGSQGEAGQMAPMNMIPDSHKVIDRTVFWSTCFMNTDCPPPGVQAYELVSTFTIDSTIDTFNDAAQDTFKVAYANLLAPPDSDLQGTVTKQDIALVITAGSLNVEARVRVVSPSLQQSLTTQIDAISPAEATTALGVTVTSKSSVTTVEQSFPSPAPPTPPRFPDGMAPPPTPPTPFLDTCGGLTNEECVTAVVGMLQGVLIAIVVTSVAGCLCLCGCITLCIYCCCCKNKKQPSPAAAGITLQGGVAQPVPVARALQPGDGKV